MEQSGKVEGMEPSYQTGKTIAKKNLVSSTINLDQETTQQLIVKFEVDIGKFKICGAEVGHFLNHRGYDAVHKEGLFQFI